MSARHGTAPRVLLVNHWHDDNRGDSAITQGIMTLVRAVDPDATFTVTTLTEDGPGWDAATRHLRAAVAGLRTVPNPAPTELRGRFPDRGRARVGLDAVVWALRSLGMAVRLAAGRGPWRAIVAEHDLVILVGGSNIFDDAGVPSPISVLRLVQVLAPARAARRQGVAVIALGHTLGPFTRRVAWPILRHACAAAPLAVVREERSVAVAREMGFTRVEEAPDMAFALEPHRSARVDGMLAALPAAPSRTLVLCVRQHPTGKGAHDERLVQEFAAAARVLVRSGDVDAVAVVAHTTGPTPVEDDVPISRRVVAELADVPVALVLDDATPGELSAFYGACAGVVAVRLHAAILGLNAGAPTFAVAYLTAKTHGVMTQVGLPAAVAEFATVTAGEIVDGMRAQWCDPEQRLRLLAAADVRRAELIRSAHGWLGAALAR